MNRVINAIPRENAADYRRVLNGKDLKTLKRKAGPKCMVSQYHKFDPRTNTHTLQLPIHFESFTYNAENDTYYVKIWTPFGVKRVRRSKRADAAKAKREMVWKAMTTHMPGYAQCIANGYGMRVQHISWIRLGLKQLDDDNLQSAFKSTRDAVCSFLVWGANSKANIRKIGKADDVLKERGVTWDYLDRKCESNPRLYGVQIKIRCAPRTTE